MKPTGYSELLSDRVWTWIHLGSLAGIVAVLVYLTRGQWFFGDEWDFILRRGFHHAERGFFLPHNEHWSTIPIIWYRFALTAFGLKSYWPYMFGLFATHLVVVHSAWRIMRRAGVSGALATGVALVLGLFGAGSENLLWAFQVGFVGSLAAGLLLVLAVDRQGSSRRVALIALGSIAMLMFSGISVVMVGVVASAVFARWGWKRAAVVAGPAATVYLVWLKVYGSVGLSSSDQYHGSLRDIPHYVWGGLSDTFGIPLRSNRAGEAVVGILALVVAVNFRRWWREAPEVLAVAAGAPVMFAVISQGRGAFHDPSAPRYLYLAAGMMLPLGAYAIHKFVADRRQLVIVALATCLVVTASGVDLLRHSARLERDRELTLKGQMLGSIAFSDTVVSDTPDFAWATEVRRDSLQKLHAGHKLGTMHFSPRDRAYTRLALQVLVLSAVPNGVALSGGIGVIPANEITSNRDGCAQVDLGGKSLIVRRAGPARATFTVTTSATGNAAAFVSYASSYAGPRVFPATAGRTAFVQEAVPGELLLQLPSGLNEICGLQWTSP